VIKIHVENKFLAAITDIKKRFVWLTVGALLSRILYVLSEHVTEIQ